MWFGKSRLALCAVAMFLAFAPCVVPPMDARAAVPDTLKRPAGAVVVPERFLRRWDPVTIFFDADAGPAAGGPEDAPGRFVTMTPTQPGAFTWLDARTLQFRPAEPWPALTEFDWTIGAHHARLVTLLPAPSETIPANGATALSDVDSLTLTMPEPVDPAVLAQMVTIDLLPLPGLGSTAGRTLQAADFEVKTMERRNRTDPATYVLRLHEPIGGGTRAVVHLRLSPQTALDGVTQDFSFATAAPFQITNFGCTGPRLPVTLSGVAYAAASALRCAPGDRSAAVQFSAPLQAPSPVVARNLVRVTPPVDNLTFRTAGTELVVSGAFSADTVYTLRLEPTPLEDTAGRSLEMTQPSEVALFFPAQQRFLRWQASQGIVERLGPQMVPLDGRGFDRVDLRVYPVDPLNRTFWPFPDRPVTTDDNALPPGPGEEPLPVDGGELRQLDGRELAGQLHALGSPPISEILGLPLRKGGVAARFGLDLKPYFERIAGSGAPGTYLVSMRSLAAGGQRSWLRLQVTDLSLTTVEEEDAVRFFVTSLATGQPVRQATVRIEGVVGSHWATIGEGATDSDGQFAWTAPGLRVDGPSSLRRIVVQKDADTLVIDTSHPPPVPGEAAPQAEGRWLDWTVANLNGRAEPPQTLCHVFTERPIYRPEDPVHIKAWVRVHQRGELTPFQGKAVLVVTGDDKVEWRYPLEMTPEGTAYYKFDEQTAATGDYEAHLEIADAACGSIAFRKEAYRLPRFEVQLHAPPQAGLDREFTVDLAARYYAGGTVTARPVRWRVTQFSYDWRPEQREGYAFSSDSRFSASGAFHSTPVLERDGKTDDDGNARLMLDPTIEPTAQPRRYVVEATVVGEDDQTVTTTEQVLALPPFVLGAKVPRFLDKATSVDPDIIAIGPDGAPVVGQAMTVRLLRREWHSTLQATDFSQGAAKYVTDIVDEKIAETKVTSEAGPKHLSFPIDRAGVYIVEIEAQDRTGRSQKLAVDLFANGGTPVSWARQPAKSFAITPDKTAYAPGDTATLVLQSPYQTGRALAVLEHADGRNVYQWVDVANGVGRLTLLVDKKDMPKLPVHVVLMRGRVAGGDDKTVSILDLRRPATVMSDVALTITPVKNKVAVEIVNPERAQPGDEIDVTLKLQDDLGKPLAGEATLWLVDQAVLALAKEQPLDPLPDFIVERDSRLVLRDSRNLTLGVLPLQEMPGGDEAQKDDGLLEKVTVRKNFTPLPYYNPRLMIGPSGTVTVKVKLPDSLTNFKLRAKVVSGPDRFGFGTGQIAVRLPVIVEPALPRFVRPGDRFTASAIGRIVDGDGGPGLASVRVEGLTLSSPATQSFEWQKTPTRIDEAVEVPTPAYGADGQLTRDSVTLTFGVERSADKARDAFAVTLPLKPDRMPVRDRQIVDLTPGAPLTLPAITEPYRPGTLKRSLTLAAEPALVRLAASLDYLREYQFACTEQRVSGARAEIAARRFHDLLLFDRTADRTTADYNATVAWIKGALDANGLVGYWPGSTGSVALTAWTLQFLTEAQSAGLPVDQKLADGLVNTLRQSLRSDYPYVLTGEGLAERVWALTALAGANVFDPGYAAELLRRSQSLSLESRAQALGVLGRGAQSDPTVLASLDRDVWGGIVFRLVGDKEAYGGLQTDPLSTHPLLLPSEARTLAQVIRATTAPEDASKRRLIVDALVASAGPTGWGSTNANAEAFLALSEFFETASGSERSVTLAHGGGSRDLTLDPARPIARFNEASPDLMTLTAGGVGAPLALLADTRYLPVADDSTVAAKADGFVVTSTVKPIDGTPGVVLDQPGKRLSFAVGTVVEYEVELVNPEERHQVAIVIPLAAGMEPLNPRLATAPPEAKPSHDPTLAPTYVAFLDDQIAYFYDTLPKGTYSFAFRTRATIPGRFVQPPASAEMMYQEAVAGNGNGAEIVIERR